MMSRYKGLSWSLLSHGQIHTNQYWSEPGLIGISEPLGFYMTLWLYLSHCVCLKWMWGICRWQRQCKCRCISFLSMCLSTCVLAGHGCWVLINNFLQYSDGFRCHISHLPSKVWLEKNKNDRFTWPTNLEGRPSQKYLWCYPAAGHATLGANVAVLHPFFFFEHLRCCVLLHRMIRTHTKTSSCAELLDQVDRNSSGPSFVQRDDICFLTGNLKGNWKTMKNTRGQKWTPRSFWTLLTSYVSLLSKNSGTVAGAVYLLHELWCWNCRIGSTRSEYPKLLGWTLRGQVRRCDDLVEWVGCQFYFGRMESRRRKWRCID